MNRAALLAALCALPLACLSACDGTSGDLFVEKAPDTGASGGGTMTGDAGGSGAAGGGGAAQECIDRQDEKIGDCRPLDQWMKDSQLACDGLKLNLDHASVKPIDPERCPPMSADGVAYRCCTIPPADGCVTGDISEPYKCQEPWMLQGAAMERCMGTGLRLADLSLSGDCIAGTDPAGKEIQGFKIAKYTCCPPPKPGSGGGEGP